MTFLGPKIMGNWKPEKDPNKIKPSAREKREGNSKAHLALIRKLPSCLSGRRPCDPHHLRIAKERGVGMKATDKWAIPLTRDEHEHIHKFGSKKEAIYFKSKGFNPYALATALWKATGDLERMEKIVEAHNASKQEAGE